jgi:hypothetical protein
MTLRINSLADLPPALRALNDGKPRPTYADNVANMARAYGKQEDDATRAAPAKKRSKYRNEPTYIDGERFDSKLEGRCYEQLKLRRAAGEVRFFLRQVSFPLEGKVVYRCDFFVVLAAGGIEVIDATGMVMQVKANKLKQMRERYGIEVQLWKGKT